VEYGEDTRKIEERLLIAMFLSCSDQQLDGDGAPTWKLQVVIYWACAGRCILLT